jgi:hypothetical protein
VRKFLVILLILLVPTSVYAFRISRPQTFSLPWDKTQVTQLNDYLESVWNLQNGEFNLDIVTSPKNNAFTGDVWLIKTGVTVAIQYKANDRVFTVSPN